MGCLRGLRPAHRIGTALILLGGLLATHPAAADPPRDQREQSNLSVMGIEELESPTHRETFAMLENTPDPIEGFNRGSLAFTRPFIDWLMLPLAKGWRFVSPDAVRTSLENFYYNLGFPGRFVSLLLQAEAKQAGTESARFAVNSTLGIAGLFNPAQRLGIPTHREDFGLTFARWGSGPGFYFFLPLLGPSSGRDALGRIFDTALHPTTYVPGSGLVFNVNAFSGRIDGYETLVGSYDDVYLPVRALWSVQRQIAAERYTIPEEAYARSDPDPSLGNLLFKPRDPEFWRRGSEHRVELPTTGRSLPYSVWIQREKSSFVVILPGIGSHRSASTAVALAELLFEAGHSVVVVSNPFHREFISNALSASLPGYTPSDAEDIYAVLERVRDDIDDRYGPKVSSSHLLGYSLGGVEALFIAAAQAGRPEGALRFDSFVAINPPVDLAHAAAQFDACFDEPLSWPEAERDRRVLEAAMKAFIVLREGELDEPLPLDRAESRFLIGFMGRAMLIDTLATIEERAQDGGADARAAEPRRGPLADRINANSFTRYSREQLAPSLQPSTGLAFEELRRRASLPHLAAQLAGARVRILTNADDFLLGADDLRWLEAEFAGRLQVFPGGGHLGNLHRPEVQRAILGALSE